MKEKIIINIDNTKLDSERASKLRVLYNLEDYPEHENKTISIDELQKYIYENTNWLE